MALQADKPRILIIGSGAAGIAAASRLLKNGIEDVTVLEAEDRIGGRIFSVEFGKNNIDLGAEWCHGEEDNIVFDLVKDLNLIHPCPHRFPKVYHSKIKNVDQNFTEELFYLFQSIYLENKTGANCSLGDYLEKRYNEVIQVWKDDKEKFLLASDFIGYYNKWMLSHEGSFSLYNITADYDYVECPGHQRLFWNGLGFKAILDVLMNSSQRFPILLKKEVFMHFSKRWWDDSFLGYIFVWDKDDLDVKNFPAKFQQDGKTWLTSTVYVTAVEENFSVLEVGLQAIPCQ
ncbi:hypothetical protein FQA39_LY16253 [Lamprigera yunnana]|nr:hypothetical protein FQA39_LY16253 [Lamprigera yunnana]